MFCFTSTYTCCVHLVLFLASLEQTEKEGPSQYEQQRAARIILNDEKLAALLAEPDSNVPGQGMHEGIDLTTSMRFQPDTNGSIVAAQQAKLSQDAVAAATAAATASAANKQKIPRAPKTGGKRKRGNDGLEASAASKKMPPKAPRRKKKRTHGNDGLDPASCPDSRRFQNPLAQYLKCRRLSSANASSKCVVVCTCGRSGHPTKPDHRPLLHNDPATAPFYHPCPCAVVSCHPAIPTQHPGWPCHPTVPAACLPSLPSVCDWVLIVGC